MKNSKTIIILLVFVQVLLMGRLVTLGLSDYGEVHGFNEAIYHVIGSEYDEHPASPAHDQPIRDGQVWFYDTPPLTTYSIFVSQAVFGENEFASRFPSWIAMAGVVVGVGILTASIGGKTRESLLMGSAFAAASPWVLVWGGRAQTDIHLAAAVVWFLVGLLNHEHRHAKKVVFASVLLGMFAKQTFPIVFLAFFFMKDKKQVANNLWFPVSLAGMLTVLWWTWQFALHPDSVLASFLFHGAERSAPFENWVLVLVYGFVAAAAPSLLIFYKPKEWDWRLMGPGLAFLAFAFVNSPIAHQYYTLPAIPLFAAQAAKLEWKVKPLVIVLSAGALLSIGFLGGWGDLGSHRVEGAALALPDEGNVTVPAFLHPQLELYSGRQDLQMTQNWTPEPVDWIVTYAVEPTCRLEYESTGADRVIRVYECQPSP